jgi:hypothetical protein
VHVAEYNALICTPLPVRIARATLADAKISPQFLGAIGAVRRSTSIAGSAGRRCGDQRY